MPLITINGIDVIMQMAKSYIGVYKIPEFELRVLGNPKFGLRLLGACILLNNESVRVMRDKP